MKKDSIIDYLGYITLKLLGPVVRILPLNFSLFLGRRLGDLLFYFDFRHRVIAYSNIKKALGHRLSPYQINTITHGFYQDLCQSVIEIFLMPLIDKKYINKYITIEGLDCIVQSFKRGKGTIFLAMHTGSWELSSLICANLGFPFSLFVRGQRYPRLNRLLNRYRMQKGCHLIQKENQLRRLIEVLRNNEAIGMTLDQGGKTGVLVKFFDKTASMATGAIRLALKYDATIIPAFYARLSGPYVKLILGPLFEVTKTQDKNIEKDLYENIKRLVPIFENNIIRYPKTYLWTYKIWKYTSELNILILSDSKIGHLRQSEGLAKIVSAYLKEKDIIASVDTIEIKFKNSFARNAIIFSCSWATKNDCQGCLKCLKTFLKNDNYKSLIAKKPDIIISCGSSIAAVNFILSRENQAKSMVVMRPSILSTNRFDLVVMPRHDMPPKRKNVVVTDGALNLVDEDYLSEQSRKLMDTQNSRLSTSNFYIGLLIGGDTKNFSLKPDTMIEVVRQVKSAAKKLNADILVTTSRRSSQDIDRLIKEEFKDYPSCKLMVIANEKNSPFAVGGILGLSKIIVVSPDSISMVSEAASSKRYVFVFRLKGLDKRHQRFINCLVKNKYIYLTDIDELGRNIEEIWIKKPKINVLRDSDVVMEAIKRVL